MSRFSGFRAAIEACTLDWRNVDLGIAPEDKVLQVHVTQPLTLPCARICHPESWEDAESRRLDTTLTSVAPSEKRELDQKRYW